MSNAFVVHVCIAVFNFLASIIQGLTGFGDAVLLHVLWYTACVAKPDIFLHTALGDNPVSAVALLMYIRIIFSAPLVAYLSFKDGIFSWSITIAMAVPSTVCAIIGVFVFQRLQHGDVLKEILGISSLVFAILYIFILAGKYAWKQKRVKALMERMGIKKKSKKRTDVGGIANATTQSAVGGADSLVDRDRFHGETSASPSTAAVKVKQSRGRGRARDVVVVADETALVEEELAATRHNSVVNTPTNGAPASLPLGKGNTKAVAAGAGGGGGRKPTCDTTTTPSTSSNSSDDSSVSGVDRGGSEVYISLETGSPFHRSEARPIPVTEAGASVPPLTPSKVSPSRTLTYTRVRLNRNLDANGKIKLSTKVTAGFSAALTGVMGSMTGVGAPPQIIFILLMDVPQYVIRVNFCMQSIPSALVRFIMAIALPLFHTDMIPIFINALIAGYAGVYVGTKLGKMLGAKSYSIFVLALLLLSSLIMITTSATLLVVSTVLCTAVTIAAAWWEKRDEKSAKIAAQRALEAELVAETEHQQHQPTEVPPVMASSPLTAAALNAQRPRAIVEVPQTARDGASGTSRSEVADPITDRTRQASVGSLRRSASGGTVGSSSAGSGGGRIRKADLNRPPSLFNTPTQPQAPHPPPPVPKLSQPLPPAETMLQEERRGKARRGTAGAVAEEEELPV